MSRHPAFPLSSRMFGFAWVSSSITDTGGSIEAGWHEGRYPVVPTYLKDISTNAALLSLWNRAADALANAAQVIVIGYRSRYIRRACSATHRTITSIGTSSRQSSG